MPLKPPHAIINSNNNRIGGAFMSRRQREKFYYQDQSNWTINEYDFLYFNLNKAILTEQDWLSNIDNSRLSETTKAIIKALILYYKKFDLYQKFPNLQGIEEQEPLLQPVFISKVSIKSPIFESMGLIN